MVTEAIEEVMNLVGDRLEHWTYSWPAYNLLSDDEMDLCSQIVEWLPWVDPEANQEVVISDASQELLRRNE